MAEPHSRWTVLPHGPVVELEPGLLTVEGTIPMPLGRFPRRMTVAALDGGGTAIWSPVSLADTAMKKIEALGEPKLLVVPNQAHRMDIKPFKDRYPAARVIAPAGAQEKVEELVPLDATADPAMDLTVVPGMKLEEFAWTRRGAGGITLVLNDVLANVRHPKGLGAQLMARIFGFGVRRPRMSRPVRRMFVDDAPTVAARFRAWADMPDLSRVIVSHGEVIDEAAAAALRRAPDDLD